jgi:adenylosuccinate synthase
VGYFDLLTTRYALEVAGRPDYLAITNIDRLKTVSEWKICTAYAYQGEQPDLSDYFEHDQGKASKINVCQPIDLVHQEKLTQKLLSCTPEYLTFTSLPGERRSNEELAAYLALLEEMLSVPIAISSYGLTAREKQWGRQSLRLQ